MSLLSRAWEYFSPPPITTVEALQAFLTQRASLIAQKCAIDYCRGKTGLASYALFTEKPFLDALDVCRWETFVAVLGDLLIVVEGSLRPYSGEQHARLCEALIALYAAALAEVPALTHRARGWDDAKGSFELRFKSAAAGKPHQALDVADHSAKRLFDTLPIHSRYRELDEEPVYGSVRFRMIAVSQEMQRRLRGADLARELLAQNVTL
jgi:hypothetical protein